MGTTQTDDASVQPTRIPRQKYISTEKRQQIIDKL